MTDHDSERGFSRSLTRILPKILVVGGVACGWTFVAYLQMVLAISRLFPESNDPWPMGNIIAGMVLIYLPAGLAFGISWIMRRRSLLLILLAHIAGMLSTFVFWFM